MAFQSLARKIGSTKRYLCDLIGQITKDRTGSVIVEFAFVAPVMIMLLVGGIELGMVMFTSTLMEGAIRDASRYGITGQEPTEAARLERIRQLIGEHTLGLVDMSTAQIDVLVYPGFADIGQSEDFTDGNGNGTYDVGEAFTDSNGNGAWDADLGVPGPGGSGDIVLYRIRYDWPFLTPIFGPIVGKEALKLTASLAVRNEPRQVN